MSSKLRLDQLLVERGLVGSRTKAAALIMAGRVKVDGKRQDKAGFAVSEDAKIEIEQGPRFVSRGGDKLASVAEKLGLDFRNKIVADVGSSTGGFTDFALQSKAQKVYAIDVGTGQLDYKLRNDARVVVMEKTDIRGITALPEPIDIVLIDVSFISLRLVLPAVTKLIQPEGLIVAMVKPHFEADRKTASMNMGVIKNDTIRRAILRRVESYIKQDFAVLNKADSKVSGRKGNIERFYLLKPAKH